MTTDDRYEDLLKLEDNWNSYHSLAPKRSVARVAQAFQREYLEPIIDVEKDLGVFPLTDGGFGLEINPRSPQGRYLDEEISLSFFANGSVEVYSTFDDTEEYFDSKDTYLTGQYVTELYHRVKAAML